MNPGSCTQLVDVMSDRSREANYGVAAYPASHHDISSNIRAKGVVV